MFKRIAIVITLLFLCIVSSTSGNLVTADEHHEEKTAAPATDVCPVSGEKIDKDTKITYEFKGKTYRFCCPDCAEKFKKDPEKYINKMQKQDDKKS